MLKNYFKRFLFMLLVLIIAQSVAGQQTSEACQALPPLNDFVVIDDIKSKTQKEVAELETKIKDYRENKIPQIEKAERELVRINDEIQKLNDKPNKTPDDETQLISLTNAKSSIDNFLEGKTSQFYKDELKQFDNDYSWKVEQLRCINSVLLQMLSPLQKFKFWMSAFFAALIMLVIIGFFVIAYQDEKVRRAIFGGQTGLQFLTLFSIVIAIILFGITNILEGRELAALLGGLSGYILGKYNSTGNKDENAGETDISNRVIAQIAITPANVTLSSAKPTQQLTASLLNAQNNPITPAGFNSRWTSDNTSVATVDQAGLVTWVATGNCNVTAAVNGITSPNCVVTCI